jgi:hypothetical protein
MKRVWQGWLVVGIIGLLVACAPAKTVDLDQQFRALWDASDQPITLSDDDQDTLIGLLKMNTWKSAPDSVKSQTISLVLVGESGALYALDLTTAKPVIAMDEDADGVTDVVLEATSLDVEALLAWRDSIITAEHSRIALGESVFAQVILELSDPTKSSRYDLVALDAQEVLNQLQLAQWNHLQLLPSFDVTGFDRMTLVTSGANPLVVIVVVLSDRTLITLQDDEAMTLGIYEMPLISGSAVLEKLKILAEALTPDHELASRVFTQGYIGPMQYIYEPSQNDPAYLFTLTPAQQIALMDGLQPTTWVKVTSGEPTTLYAEFAVADTEGRMYYFTEISTETVMVTIIDPLNPLVPEEYRWETATLMTVNGLLMSYFIPGGPSLDLVNAQYTSASFYEGDVMDMTSPDITVALSAAQSKTIKDFIDPLSWKQAVDIPPMGPAIGFTLEDEDERQYTFLFVGPYVLVSIWVDDESPVVWWKGSMTGAGDARTYLLTLAP